MGVAPRFSAVEPLTEMHESGRFHCGADSLDNWLKFRALEDLENQLSRTYVTCQRETARIAGYYALSMGQVLRVDVSGRHRRNMPAAIPCVLIGRLAVDSDFRGLGLGSALLQDAVIRSKRTSGQISARFAMVHALNSAAAEFYVRHGFIPLPNQSETLVFDLK